MAGSISEVGKAAVKGALDISLEYIKGPQGGKILLHISTDNIQVAKELCKFAGYRDGIVTRLAGAATLGCMLGYRLLRPLIVDAVNEGVGGRRDDQDAPNVTPAESLHVLLHCLTDERFLEVLEDYEAGRIKERMQKEFSEVRIKVEGLKVEIENKEEVNKIKAAIKKRSSSYLTEVTEEVKEEMTKEIDSLVTDVDELELSTEKIREPEETKTDGNSYVLIKEGCPHQNDLSKMAREVTDVWRPLGHLLLLNSNDVNIIDEDEHGVVQKTTVMFERWKQQKGSDATYRELHAALVDVTVNRMDIAERFCLVKSQARSTEL